LLTRRPIQEDCTEYYFNFSYYNKIYYFGLGLAIANLLIGKLDGTPKSYLVACKELESTNYETICQFINSSLKIFPGIEQKVLLLIISSKRQKH